MKKALTSLIIIMFIVSLSASASAYTDTELFSEVSSATGVKTRWSANTDKVWQLSFDNCGKAGKYMAWSGVERREEGGTGLEPGVALELVFSVGSVALGGYDAVTFEFTYGKSVEKSDFDVGELDRAKIYVSCDGGGTYSERYAELEYYGLCGEAVRTDSGEYMSYLYDCISGDISALANGGKITHIKLKPFGDVPTKSAVFRLHEIKLVGHTGAEYAPPALPEGPGYESGVDKDAIRQIAAAEMKKYGLVEWTPGMSISITVPDFKEPLKYNKGTTYKGLVYTQQNYRGTLEQFTSQLNEKGEYTGVTAEATMPGTHCSSSVDCAWSLVTSTDFKLVGDMMRNADKNGVSLMGDLKRRDYIETTDDVYELNSKQELYSAFSCLLVGDVLMSNGHVIMVTGEPVVIKNGDGTIDGAKSYVITTENAGDIVNNSSWRVNKKNFFEDIYDGKYLPHTTSAFTDGLVERLDIGIMNGVEPEAVGGGLRGLVVSNYRIVELNATLSDRFGNVLYNGSLYNNTKLHSLYYFTGINSAIGKLITGAYHLTLAAKTGPLTSSSDTLRTTVLIDTDFKKGAGADEFLITLDSFIGGSLLGMRILTRI